MMKSIILRGFLSLIFFGVALCHPALASGGEAYFDKDGTMIDKEKYEAVSSDRMSTVKAQLKDGYGGSFPASTDPIKLRKKRIEQWAKERAQYDPKSLPNKIEIQPQKKSQ